MAHTRPLSPHLTIWKWRITMAISILHRATGMALVFGGLLLFALWLLAAASGKEAYALFTGLAGSPVGWIIWVGISWSFFQHLLSGIRHLLMDSGWGYDLGIARASATWVFVGALLLTAAFWAAFCFGSGLV